MRLQDLFPYDRTKLGFSGKFEPIGNDTFLINSTCVWVRNQILITGNTYFLFAFDEVFNSTGTAVDLIDCFSYLDTVYLLVEDVFSHEIRLLNHTLGNGITVCPWRLVDSYSVDKMIEGKYNKYYETRAS